ncbi:uncharacterized protein LOC116668223 isoform X2 [Camelus ferus]|uniref:Uncharacterized protein LOC116668223 isoform X2 n=1 Tax=Camelus ferus TaxID=419612 RepID=A0A8B8U9M1_CAMFR|nr:uncharacterized protein LOC116668223 isoform X2 [Camelus ferus]
MVSWGHFQGSCVCIVGDKDQGPSVSETQEHGPGWGFCKGSGCLTVETDGIPARGRAWGIVSCERRVEPLGLEPDPETTLCRGCIRGNSPSSVRAENQRARRWPSRGDVSVYTARCPGLEWGWLARSRQRRTGDKNRSCGSTATRAALRVTGPWRGLRTARLQTGGRCWGSAFSRVSPITASVQVVSLVVGGSPGPPGVNGQLYPRNGHIVTDGTSVKKKKGKKESGKLVTETSALRPAGK